MENQQTLDDIWERASLELDYQKITAKKGTRGPQKMDKKTLWSKKIMEHLYHTLTSTNTGNWSIDHAFTVQTQVQCKEHDGQIPHSKSSESKSHLVSGMRANQGTEKGGHKR